MKTVGHKTHTQTEIAVYTTFDEKEIIRQKAKKAGKSMSKYLLDLGLKENENN